MTRPVWLRRMAWLTSAVFLWSTLLAVPAQVLARDNRPSFGAPKPIPAPVPHDDPAWHTIDYHQAEHASPTAAKSFNTANLTLLDQVGGLARPVTDKDVFAWKQTLHGSHVPSQRAALRHIWLGEYELAVDEQPAQAQWHFRQARKLTNTKDPLYGLAAYDSAQALFAEGAYAVKSVGNGEASETVPMLHTITVPSPTGTGTQSATINYDSTTQVVTSLVDANGNSSNFNYVDGSHTQVIQKDSLGNIVYRYTVGYDMNMSQTTVTNGKVDGSGNNTQIVKSEVYADANDPYRPSQVQDGNGYAAGGAGGKGTWTYTWDAYGNCLTATTPRGTTTTNTVSTTNFALGELTQTQTGTKHKTAFIYYQPSGNIHMVTSPLPGTSGGTSNVTTTYAYSTLGNLTSVVTPGNGTVTSKTATYGYTTDGTYSQTEALGQPLTITDNLGKVSHARYDSQGRVTSAWDALGNTSTASYNIVGQGTQAQSPSTGQTGSGHPTVQNTYLYPGGPLTQSKLYDESGTQVRQVSPVYGAEGEQLTATGDTLAVTVAYDALYRMKTITDGSSHATQTTYNTTGYASQSQLANSDTYQATSWDANGNVLSSTDGRGTTLTYVYNDVESRLTDIQYPTGSGLDVHIDYDSYGRAYSQTDSMGSKSVTYDDLNLPLTQTTTYKNAAGTGYLPSQTLTYSYNADGSRSSLVTPAGTFSYSYDGRGLPSSVSNPGSETFGWTYLDNGWLWTQTLGSAAKATYTYNALGQVTELAHRKQDMAATLLVDFSSMSQDAVGNRVSLTASVPSTTAYSGSTSYTYSSKDQLTQEASTRASGYTNNNAFDSVGNPTTFKGTSQSFNSVNQNTAGSTITFDGNGNPGSWSGNTLTWNYNNKLTAVGTSLTAGYSANGLRAWKQNASSVRTYFLYDGLIPVCELDGSGNVTAYNTVGANGLLARHVNGTGGGSIFYCFDPQGSVSVRVDTSGTVLSTHCNEAWGTQVSTGSGYGTDPYAGYGGQWGYYRDSETGLHLLGHRYYDAASGRFLNRDPIGYNGGINLYAYCTNNGVRRIDPRGSAWSIISEEEGGGGYGGATGLQQTIEAGQAGALDGGGLGFGAEGPPPSQAGTGGEPITIAGHGVAVPVEGEIPTFNLPSEINTYCPHGEDIDDSLGIAIQNGTVPSTQPSWHHPAGESFYDYTIYPGGYTDPITGQTFRPITITGSNTITVEEPTPLSQLLGPGNSYNLATCRSIRGTEADWIFSLRYPPRYGR